MQLLCRYTSFTRVTCAHCTSEELGVMLVQDGSRPARWATIREQSVQGVQSPRGSSTVDPLFREVLEERRLLRPSWLGLEADDGIEAGRDRLAPECRGPEALARHGQRADHREHVHLHEDSLVATAHAELPDAPAEHREAQQVGDHAIARLNLTALGALVEAAR